jgi:hypothetical protein
MSAIRRLIIPAAVAITTLAAVPSAALAATSAAATPNPVRFASPVQEHSVGRSTAEPAASKDAAAPLAARNYFILYFNSEPPGAHRSYACNGGARYVVPALLAQAELSARNNCSVRVWLHLNPNGTGRALCIRPHSTATIRRPYRQVWISRNTATC